MRKQYPVVLHSLKIISINRTYTIGQKFRLYQSHVDTVNESGQTSVGMVVCVYGVGDTIINNAGKRLRQMKRTTNAIMANSGKFT